MKNSKILGFAVMTTLALMAFSGVGTVSATVICQNNLNTETCSAPYPIGTEGTASLQGTAVLVDVNTGKTIDTCTNSTVTGILKSQGSGQPATSELSTLTFSNCTFPTKTVSPGFGELGWIKGTDNGTLLTSGTKVTINTVLFGSCMYGTGEKLDMGTTVGGNPGSLTIETQIPFISGGAACPTAVLLNAKYVATSPTNGWISNG